MTRSKVSVDGRIAPRDVGSKLVIVMVGLPARGKSYITQKLKRYLSWQQHNTRIFNVGNRRRLVAATSAQPRSDTPQANGQTHQEMDIERQAAHILLNGELPKREETINGLSKTVSHGLPDADHMDQDASFFDPNNEQGTHIREQVALSTLDELLDYLLYDNGSVGILDATNSTIERRKVVYNRIKERAPKIGILFIESICKDENVSVAYTAYTMGH
jgi:6-phosphofructo-2-kinase